VTSAGNFYDALFKMLTITAFAARRFGLSREDEIAIVFCGSKKSLVTGIPMANALFARASLGLVVLPLMIFHQLQRHRQLGNCRLTESAMDCAVRVIMQPWQRQ
jgi:hypothetical protein